MKDWMNLPSLWQLGARVGRICGDDFEWSMTSRDKFGLRVYSFDIRSFQPG